MASKKFKAVLHCHHSQHAKEPEFCIFMSDMSGYGYAPVAEMEFEFPLPDHFDSRQAELRRLDKEEREVRAAFGKRITELAEQRNKLLAIENSAADEARTVDA